MRVERLGGDKIRFFLTLDDLVDRGIKKEDIWRDIPKVHELFNDMLTHAYEELGFEVVGPVAVEVFTLPAQGMVVIVTRGKSPSNYLEIDRDDDVYELEVTMEETNAIVFAFNDLEHLLQAAFKVKSLVVKGGKVYSYKNSYYLVFNEELVTLNLDTLVAILSEYGEVSTITDAVLDEYGSLIIANDAISNLNNFFAEK